MKHLDPGYLDETLADIVAYMEQTPDKREDGAYYSAQLLGMIRMLYFIVDADEDDESYEADLATIQAMRQAITEAHEKIFLISMGYQHIEYRDTPSGRHAYVKGSTLAVWRVMDLARDYGHDPQAVAEHLGWPVEKVQDVMRYAADHPDEINRMLARNDSLADAAIIQHNIMGDKE